MKKLTQEQFILKAKLVHGDKYDYSETVYSGKLNKVIITCPVHGGFTQNPGDHVNNKAGCPECKRDALSRAKLSNIDEFIAKANRVHSNKYSYSGFNYVNSTTKSVITCQKHDDFLQTPNDHLSGKGCFRCKKEKIGNIKRLTKDEIIFRAVELHGDKFAYEKVKVTEYSSVIEIFCNTCKNYFTQSYHSHLQGAGCLRCKSIRIGDKTRLTREEIIERFIRVHGDKYNYDKFIYVNCDTKSTITCPLHGDFEQSPHSHYHRTSGCSKCKSSKGELALMNIFKKHDIKYVHQFKLPFYNRLRYDFYLPDYNLIIEFHGGQHFKPVAFFGGEEGYRSAQRRDTFKRHLAKEYKIRMLVFTFKHLRLPKEQFEKMVLKVLLRVSQMSGQKTALTSSTAANS